MFTFLGDPGYQNGVAVDIGVSKSKIIPFILGQVVDKSKEWLVFPTGRKILKKQNLNGKLVSAFQLHLPLLTALIYPL